MFKKTSQAYIYSLKGVKPGPTVTIMGGTHGDEICGVKIFFWLKKVFKKKFQLKCGKLIIILANPKAAKISKRYVNHDLNRLYGENLFQNHKNCYECERIKILKKILKKVDYLLDIHSTSKPTQPMTCSKNSNKHLEICKILPVKFITTNWNKKVEGMASDQYVDQLGGIGITIECGSNKQKKSYTIAQKAVIQFLEKIKMIKSHTSKKNPSSLKKITSQQKHIKIVKTVYPNSLNFKFIEKIKNFSQIKKGNKFASDGDKKFIADKNYFIVMPSKKIKKGIEACFLGIEIKNSLKIN